MNRLCMCLEEGGRGVKGWNKKLNVILLINTSIFHTMRTYVEYFAPLAFTLRNSIIDHSYSTSIYYVFIDSFERMLGKISGSTCAFKEYLLCADPVDILMLTVHRVL